MFDDETDDFASEFEGDFGNDLPETVDEAAIERMRLVANVLDDLVRIPGTDIRIGADPILGLLPVAGDVVSAGLSLYVVLESARLGVSFPTLLRMLANVTIDVAGGSIPYVGPVFDAAWKANKRNIELAIEDLTDGHASGDDEDDEAVVIEIT
jgi:hypothetical protein